MLRMIQKDNLENLLRYLIYLIKFQDVDDLKKIADLKEKQFAANLKNLQEEIDEKNSIIRELQANLQTKDE